MRLATVGPAWPTDVVVAAMHATEASRGTLAGGVPSEGKSTLTYLHDIGNRSLDCT